MWERPPVSCCLPLPGAWRPRAALWLLGADWLGSGRRGWQPAEWRVGCGRPAEQPTHADQRRERLQDPQGPIHRHSVFQGPLLQPWILWGEARNLNVFFMLILNVCFLLSKGKKTFVCVAFWFQGSCWIQFQVDKIIRFVKNQGLSLSFFSQHVFILLTALYLPERAIYIISLIQSTWRMLHRYTRYISCSQGLN